MVSRCSTSVLARMSSCGGSARCLSRIRLRLLPQPGGFEGVGEGGVVRHANYESILQLVDHAAIPLDRDAALFSRPRLVEERHDSVIAPIYEAVEMKRPVVE